VWLEIGNRSEQTGFLKVMGSVKNFPHFNQLSYITF
jgi:hypothetical protein